MQLDLSTLTDQRIRKLSNAELTQLADEVARRRSEARKEVQLLYYEPVSPDALKVHASSANKVGLFGGNRSGKTETVLVQYVALCTGMWPTKYDHLFRPKFRGPVQTRVIVPSLMQDLVPVFLPKLQYFKWTGRDAPGGHLGHWGWVPRGCLLQGQWDKSWSTKHNTLTMLCRDPDNHKKVVGESIMQFMSHNNEPAEFASGTFHHILHDEPPPEPIWRESQSRVLDNGGTCHIAMTWSDDPAVNQDWIHDEIVERSDAPNIDVIELSTLDNQHLDQDHVAQEIAGWTEDQRSVRVHGQSLTFANRVHPLFTEIPKHWSQQLGKVVAPRWDDEGRSYCPVTGSEAIPFCHVVDDDPPLSHWPAVFLLDPHPRKPHMFTWVVLTPSDDYFVIADGACKDAPLDTRVMVEQIEIEHRINTRARLMDPNMGRSPSGAKREVTWQDEFDVAGLRCDLADDGSPGRRRIDEWLQPDAHTLRPRLLVHRRCHGVIQQMKRYAWDDFNKALNRDQKQTPRDKYSDYPTLLKYFANYSPSFRTLHDGPVIIRTRGHDDGTREPRARFRAQA